MTAQDSARPSARFAASADSAGGLAAAPRRARRPGWGKNRPLLVLILLAACLSLLLSLGGLGSGADFWLTFAISLLFVLWCVLGSAALVGLVLGSGRHWPLWLQLGACVFVIQLVVGLFSLAIVVGPQGLRQASALAISDPMLFIGRNLGIGAIVALLFLRYQVLQQRWQAQVRAESQARLGALQSRIRPHFLFNTLNTISSLIHDHPDQAEQATMDLADLLRTGLKDDSSHALADELELIRGYLRIEQLRLGDRLEVIWDLAEDLPLDQHLPPLLLQPLVENAVVHGISRRAEGGTLRIEGRRIRFGRIRFTVSNPLADPDSRPAEGSGSALENIRQRLALAYEERYGLKTGIDAGINDGIDNGRFIAALTIPVTA